ncbi:MAG: Flagella-associated protein [uncultured bacterium]|nr:MAG: Flagella-associated protein [uncultured bacterium]
MIVSKVSKTQNLSDEISAQTFDKWRPLLVGSGILAILALIPGLPLIPFATMALTFGTAGVMARNKEIAAAQSLEGGGENSLTPGNIQAQEKVEVIPTLDMLEVEVGYDLIPLVDQRSGGEFPARIIGIRRQFANEMGVLIPPVHIRDNLKLRPSEYRVYLKGAVVGQGELMPHHCLALDPGMTTRKIEGVETKDPTFGLDALWIAEDNREAAIVSGYTVVDLPSVMATHLIEIVRQNLHEIIGRQELATLMDQVKTTHPRVVSDLIPETLNYGIVLKVIQNLLRERVSARDMVSILESLAEHGTHTKDADELTEYVRVALGRNISQQHALSGEGLYVITLARNVEEKIARSVTVRSGSVQLGIDPVTAKTLVEQIGMETRKHLGHNRSPVLLTSQQVRPHLFKLIEKFIPNLPVLSHSEVAGHVPVKHLGIIGEAT